RGALGGRACALSSYAPPFDYRVSVWEATVAPPPGCSAGVLAPPTAAATLSSVMASAHKPRAAQPMTKAPASALTNARVPSLRSIPGVIVITQSFRYGAGRKRAHLASDQPPGRRGKTTRPVSGHGSITETSLSQLLPSRIGSIRVHRRGGGWGSV